MTEQKALLSVGSDILAGTYAVRVLEDGQIVSADGNVLAHLNFEVGATSEPQQLSFEDEDEDELEFDEDEFEDDEADFDDDEDDEEFEDDEEGDSEE